MIRIVIFLLFWSMYTFANGAEHPITVGGGMALPSEDAGLFENPAGVIYNQGGRLSTGLSSDNNDFSSPGAEGNLYLGNGTVGAKFGFEQIGRSDTSLELGLGAIIESLDLVIGLLGYHDLAPALGAQAWDMNAGILINPKGRFRFGFSVFDTFGSPSLGLGLSYDVAKEASLSLDASSNDNLKGKVLKPAIGIHIDNVSLMFGYGFALDHDGSSIIRTGVGAGVGLKLQSVLLDFYYNTNELYALRVSVPFK